MSVFFGFIILFVLPSSPERLRWGFSAAEKEIGLRRYREAFNVEGDNKIRGAQILGALQDPKTSFYGRWSYFYTLSFRYFIPANATSKSCDLRHFQRQPVIIR
jgi:hypothetical protein